MVNGFNSRVQQNYNSKTVLSLTPQYLGSVGLLGLHLDLDTNSMLASMFLNFITVHGRLALLFFEPRVGLVDLSSFVHGNHLYLNLGSIETPVLHTFDCTISPSLPYVWCWPHPRWASQPCPGQHFECRFCLVITSLVLIIIYLSTSTSFPFQLAAFNMGSTVVLIFQAPVHKSLKDEALSSDFRFCIKRGDRIHMGEAIGRWRNSQNDQSKKTNEWEFRAVYSSEKFSEETVQVSCIGTVGLTKHIWSSPLRT